MRDNWIKTRDKPLRHETTQEEQNRTKHINLKTRQIYSLEAVA